MSGGPDDKAALLHQLIHADHTIVTHDAAIGLAGATAGEPGIIVIAGTGSMAFGQNARGENGARRWLGLYFRRRRRSFRYRPPSSARSPARARGLGCPYRPHARLARSLGRDRPERNAARALQPRVAALPRSRSCPHREPHCRRGRSHCPCACFTRPQELALLTGSVRRQLWSETDSSRGPVIVSWAGGVFESRLVAERFRTLMALESDVVCEPPRHGPAEGALLLAWLSKGLELRPRR